MQKPQLTLPERDRKVVWHPYTQMHTAPLPLPVVRGEGAKLFLEDGRELIDMISSWWVTVHGHSHPYLAEAVAEQARTLDQVIFANCTHPQAVRLAERIVEKSPEGISRVFFSDDGSTAVEVGLKMAWQYWLNKGEDRRKIICLENAYHGDTFGAMSVSARSVFTEAFGPLLFDVIEIPSPGDHPVEIVLEALKKACEAGDSVALILEPLIQGAGGMSMYGPEALDKLSGFCREKGIPVIFDEVMTGFYRTGKLFAADHCEIKPDIMCLSKGLTGGFLPLSLTICTDEIYQAFLSEDKSKMLFHGHSFTANPIGCAVANASLDLFEEQDTKDRIAMIVEMQEKAAERFRQHPALENIRHTGTILAMDMKTEGASGYLNMAGKMVAEKMLEKGFLVRPLGNVLYLMPPYVVTKEELEEVYDCLWETISGR